MSVYDNMMFCEHANENPNVCPCQSDCNCRRRHCRNKPYPPVVDASRVPTPQASEPTVFTAEEADAILRSVRPLDCGALHCRYCPAGSHNGWEHTEYCAYDESTRLVEKARQAIGNHFPTKAHAPAPTPEAGSPAEDDAKLLADLLDEDAAGLSDLLPFIGNHWRQTVERLRAAAARLRARPQQEEK